MPAIESNNSRIAKNTLFLYIRMAFVLVVSLYTSRVMLRTLGVVDYGVNNVVAGFISMFSFLNTALSSGVQRFFNYELGKNGESGASKVYNTAIIIQALLAIILIILLETIGLWYVENKMVIPADRMDAARVLYQMAIASMAVVIMQVPFSAAIMAYERMDYYAIVGIIDVLLKLGIVIAIPFIPFDKLVLFGSMSFIIAVINFLFYYSYTKIKFRNLKFKFVVNKDLIGSMLGFSGWHVFGTFSLMMQNQGVNLIINIFFGPAVNAARGVSFQIKSALMGFINNITIAARPQMVQAYAQDNIKRTMNLMYSISKICFIAMYVMVLPICFEIDFILGIWLGKDVIPEMTQIFTIWVLTTSMIDILNSLVSMVVHATGKMRTYQIITSLFCLLILPIGYALFKIEAPPVSIFIVTFIITLLNQIISLYILRSLVPFSISQYMKQVAWPIVLVVFASVWVPFLFSHFFHESVLRFFINLFVSFAIIASASYLLALNKSEKEIIREYLVKVINKIKRT